MGTIKEKASLVIIGGGAAGMPAALEAIEQGIKDVLLVDKSKVPGGNARMAGGFLFATDAYTHKEAGIEYHTDEVYKEALEFHHYDGINQRLLYTYIKQSAQNLDWLREKGLEYEWCPMGNKIVGAGAPGSYAKVLDVLRKEYLEAGGRFMGQTQLKDLLLDEKGAVCGVVCENKDGDTVEISTKNVILCTGGFMGNPELMKQYFTGQYDADAYSTDAVGYNGIGIEVAERAGALMAPFATLCKESGYSFARKKNCPHRISMTDGSVWINKDGIRFCDESKAVEHTNANVLIQQPGMCGYSIMDADIMQSLIDHPTPQVNNEFLAPGDEKIRLQLEEAAKNHPDLCLVTDSLDEIAEWIGADPKVFQNTIAEYNQYCAEGKDADFLKDKKFLMPIAKAPYYVCKFNPLMIETIGPIKVNEHLQVLHRETRLPIPGFYVAGALASGWQGHDYELWGSNLGFGLFSGRTAAAHAAQNL
jgi:fumarate reductase flavoprotein subunit